MIKYLTPFIITFFLTILFIIFFLPIAKKIKWRKRLSQRHIHQGKIYRIGGLAMALAFNLGILLNSDLVISPELYALIIGSLAIMIFGFWDDLKELYWKVQLTCQIGVAIFIFILGVRIYYVTNPFVGGILDLSYGWGVVLATFLVIFWVILVMNAINWLDGIDGLSGGTTAVTAATIFFLSLRPEVNQPPVAIISAAFFGAVLAFIIFNFYPSRIMAGTSGSMFMGLTIAVLAVFSGTKIATSLLVLSIPIIDFIWVIKERYQSKKSIFQPDKRHLHYKLLDLGWSQRQVAIFYYAITTVIAVIALNTRIIGKSITILSVLIFMIIVYFIINKKTKKNIE